MTLREKTLLTTCAILVGMIALLFLISNLILGSSVAEEERQSVNQSVARAVVILDHEISGLASIASDWGPWDDTYAFIENGDEAYIRSNLVDSTFVNLRLNLMLFVNSSGRSVYAGGFDLQNQKQVPVPASLMEQLTPDNPLLQHPDLWTKTSGIILLPEGPLLVASNPILTSNEEGPVRGTLIVGRFLNEAEAALLPELTRSSVQVHRFDDPRLPRGVQTLSASGGNLPLFIQTQNDRLVTGYTLLRDIYDKPALALSVDLPRSAHELAQESLLYLLSALSGVGLMFVLANRAVLNGFILSRLDNLSAEIQRIGLSGDLTARVTITGKDELTRLAEHINGMLAALASSQQRRLESEQRYRAVVQETADGIFLLDLVTKRILEANAAFQNLVGYTAEELAGLTLYDLVAHDGASIDANLQRLLTEKRQSFGERKYRRKSGSLVEVEVSANLITDGGREVACVIVRDVTRRKWAEDALRRNEAHFRALIDNSLDVIGILNADGTVCYLSPAIERMLGFKPERLMGRNAFDMIHRDDAANVRSIFARGIRDPNFTASVEFRLQHRDGSWVNVGVTARSLLENPAVMGIVFSLRDLTPRKQAERELEEARSALERRNRQLTQIVNAGNSLRLNLNFDAVLREIVEAAHDSLGFGTIVLNLLDREGKRLRVRAHAGLDEEGRQVLGEAVYDWEEVARLMQEQFRLGRCYFIPQGEVNWDQDFSGPTYNIVKEGTSKAGVGDKAWMPDDALFIPIELRGGDTAGILWLDQPLDGRRPNQDTLQALEIYANQAAVAIENARLYEKIQEELTERRRTEEALRESEERYRGLVELSPDAILLQSEGRIVFANAAAATLMRAATPAELHGKALPDLVHPDYRESVEERNRPQREEGETLLPLEAKFICLDSAEVDVEVSASPFTYQGKPAIQVIVHDITTRKRRESERLRRADEAEALYETTRDLAVQGDLPNLLQSSVERAMTLLNAPCGFIYQYDAAQRALELTVEKGMTVPPGLRLSLGEGLAGEVAQTLQPLIVDDYHTWAHRSPQYAGVPYAAIVEVPMLYGGELIGVLGVSEVGSSERKFTEADARLLSLFAVQAAGAVHNANLLQQTRARAEQLALLYDAGLALNSVLEPRAQLEFLFRIATRTLHADRVEFFRYDPARSELNFELGVGYAHGAQAAVHELAFARGAERGVVGQVARERIPQYLPDVSSDPRWVAVDPEIQSALMVPVEHENQLLGVLSILSRHTRAFTPQDERLLALFANQAAVALENARLFEETRRRADQLAILNRIASALSQTLNLDELLEVIYREILAALHADAFFIALYDDATGELNYRIRVDEGVREPPERRRLAPGLTAHVIYSKKPLLIHDWELEKDLYPPVRLWGTMKAPRAWLSVPMLFRDTVVGVISLQSYRANVFDEEEERLLATIADQAAVAVEKARLFAETEHRLQRLHALGDIDKAISSSLDLRVTLEVVLDQVSTQLHVDAADILLHNPHTQMLSYGSSRGFRSRALQYTELRLGEGLAGTAALERRIVHYPDLTLEADGLRRSPLLAQEGFVAYFAVPLIAKGEVKGVLEIFHRSSLEPDQEWLDFAQALGAQAAIAIDDAQLFQDLQRTNVELTLAYDATIEGWARALELRDQETEGHTRRVTELTLRLARMMGMREEELVQVRRGTVLHDVGKMAIPDSILFKPGKLSTAEWEIMQRHPTYAYEMLSPIGYLRQALDIPYCHHEKWDGTGYPRGLKGEQIPLMARIFAVVDVWDALRSDRRYRAERSEEQARSYIREQAGKHFDPKVVEKFLEIDMETW